MFKVRIKFEKNEYSAYISHLDLMNTLQRSLVRAKLPVRYTEGFNPHIYLSILVPLSTGYQSQCELADFDLTTDTLPEDLADRLNGVLPHGLWVLEVGQASRPVNQIAFCGYEVHYSSPWDAEHPRFVPRRSEDSQALQAGRPGSGAGGLCALPGVFSRKGRLLLPVRAEGRGRSAEPQLHHRHPPFP